MKKWLQKRLKNEKGLTLVELLAVIVILGIIAAIAVPSIGNIITNSKVSALKADGQNVLAAANLYFVENDKTTDVTTTKLLADGYLQDTGGFETEATIKKVDGGNTINGTAKNGEKISVVFADATNAEITAADVKTGGTNVTVNR